MSGVYFPKMQLPDKCKNCDLVFDLRASMYCPVSGEFIDFDDTPETAKCPGIPVPDHGRLVDADALEKVMVEGIAPSERGGGFQHPYDILRALVAAPTIIPASEDTQKDGGQGDV